MEALHPLLLMRQNTALKAAGIEALLLAGTNTQILVGNKAHRLAIAIHRVAILRPFQRHGAYGRNHLFHTLNRRRQHPVVKDTFLWVCRVRLGAQNLALFRRHGDS